MKNPDSTKNNRRISSNVASRFLVQPSAPCLVCEASNGNGNENLRDTLPDESTEGRDPILNLIKECRAYPKIWPCSVLRTASND